MILICSWSIHLKGLGLDQIKCIESVLMSNEPKITTSGLAAYYPRATMSDEQEVGLYAIIPSP